MENNGRFRKIVNKDVQLVTGRKERQARRLLTKIRKKLFKQREQDITIAEFCCFMGYEFEKVYRLIESQNN